MNERQQNIVNVLKPYLDIGARKSSIQILCRQFAERFDSYILSGKAIAVGKFQTKLSKSEKAILLVKNVGKDIVSIFSVPTNTAEQVLSEATSRMFEQAKAKRYESLSGKFTNITHIQLLSQALSYALLFHYGKDLLGNIIYFNDPAKRGRTAAELVLKLYKKELKAVPDTLNAFLKQLLQEVVEDSYLFSKKKQPNQTPIQPITLEEEDYNTLLLLATDYLLGKEFGYHIEYGCHLEYLEETLEEIVERLNSRVKDAIQISGLTTGGHLVTVAAGTNPPGTTIQNTQAGGHAFICAVGTDADVQAQQKDAETRQQLLSEPVPPRATPNITTTSTSPPAADQPSLIPTHTFPGRGQVVGKGSNNRIHTLGGVKQEESSSYTEQSASQPSPKPAAFSS